MAKTRVTEREVALSLRDEAEATNYRVRLGDLVIRTKEQGVAVLKPNAVQEKYLEMLVPNWRYQLCGDGEWLGIGRGHREIILKARQFGFSTLLLALFFLDTVNTANTKTVVIAHDSDSTEGLFRIVRRFYDELPDGKRPPTKYSNKRELLFKHNASSFSVLTAGTKTSGRSATINNLLCSEIAFWANAEVITGLLQAVPETGNIFQETTANGEGNAYWEAYHEAKNGESPFTARFFGWHEHTEYRAKPPAGFVATVEEAELARRFGLDDWQLWWRRKKIKEPGLGSLFKQEYPADDIEAFLVSGSKFFTEWDEERHVVLRQDVEAHWRLIGGLDWGFGSPFCFLLGAVDENGAVWVIDEIYRRRVINLHQAALIVECLKNWNVDISHVQIAADPSMWAQKTWTDGEASADIDAFQGAGLNCIKANNNRRHGWMNVRNLMAKQGMLNVFRGGCPNLIRTIPAMVHDRVRVEDLDTLIEDHAVDALRYMVSVHLYPAKLMVDGEDAPLFLRRAVKRALI